jgi:hypothetical protein
MRPLQCSLYPKTVQQSTVLASTLTDTHTWSIESPMIKFIGAVSSIPQISVALVSIPAWVWSAYSSPPLYIIVNSMPPPPKFASSPNKSLREHLSLKKHRMQSSPIAAAVSDHPSNLSHLNSSLQDVSDPSLARLPIRDNIKWRIPMIRQNKQVVKEPCDLNFPSVPSALTTNHRQEMFLQCDTGPGERSN